MLFKSHIQPLCRSCGKPIPKHTRHFRVTTKLTDLEKDQNNRGDDEYRLRILQVDAFPTNKKELQKLTNAKVVSVGYTRIKDHWDDEHWKEQYISEFTTWDGESYRDAYFCNSTRCAVKFAYMTATGPVQSVAYCDALKKQRGEKV